MNTLINVLEWPVKQIGEKASYITGFLIFLIITDVTFRYLFSNSKTWIIELEWHLFALIFLLGSSYALQRDEHVRVDLFYVNFSDKSKAIINLLGHVFFLLPFCAVVIYTSFNYAAISFSFLEGSPNPGGLPARYLLKACIAFGFVLLMIQCIAEIIKCIKKIIT